MAGMHRKPDTQPQGRDTTIRNRIARLRPISKGALIVQEAASSPAWAAGLLVEHMQPAQLSWTARLGRVEQKAGEED